MENNKYDLNTICRQFQVDGTFTHGHIYGTGHINDTYAVYFSTGHINDTFTVYFDNSNTKRYLLQRINHFVFKKPKEVMENVLGVTAHLKNKIIKNGGDYTRETLNVVLTKDNLPYYLDASGNYWRMYLFIENTITYETIESAENLYSGGKAFGNFQKLLSDYNASTLHETIVNFHNTMVRFENLLKAIDENSAGRKNLVLPEIEFAMERKADTKVIQELLDKKEIPTRVTHNDTKLNNVLFDDKTKKAICIVDLDTVMPGSVLFDFGDTIRFGANTGLEDEVDLSKISLSIPYFTAFAKGFLEETKDDLTEKEIELLAFSSKILTFECGIRFLTDYLNGDVYFKIHRENHNLDRCRTQFKLVADMESKMDEMNHIIKGLI